jgi:hypothetical protein
MSLDVFLKVIDMHGDPQSAAVASSTTWAAAAAASSSSTTGNGTSETMSSSQTSTGHELVRFEERPPQICVVGRPFSFRMHLDVDDCSTLVNELMVAAYDRDEMPLVNVLHVENRSVTAARRNIVEFICRFSETGATTEQKMYAVGIRLAQQQMLVKSPPIRVLRESIRDKQLVNRALRMRSTGKQRAF